MTDITLKYRKDVAKGIFAVMLAELREAALLSEDKGFVQKALDQITEIKSICVHLEDDTMDLQELDNLIDSGRILLVQRWLAQAGFKRP